MKRATEKRTFVSIALFAFSILVFGSSASNLTAQDWPQFRGTNGNATAPDATTPTTWSDSENIAWKTKLPGRGSSSPIVVGDRIFLTAYSGYGMSGEAIAKKGGRQRGNRNRKQRKQENDPAKAPNKTSGAPASEGKSDDVKDRTSEGPGNKADLKLHMLCFDRATGKLDWDVSIAASEAEQEFTTRVADHGYVSGTPASDGEAVYAFFGVSGACAFDFDGNQLWHNDKLGSKTAGFGSASSPVVFENMVFINASIEGGTLYALDKKTGDIIWKKTGIEKCWSSPCVAKTETGETELVINQKETVYGLNPKTGEEVPITPRRVLVFKPSQVLRERVDSSLSPKK